MKRRYYFANGYEYKNLKTIEEFIKNAKNDVTVFIKDNDKRRYYCASDDPTEENMAFDVSDVEGLFNWTFSEAYPIIREKAFNGCFGSRHVIVELEENAS